MNRWDAFVSVTLILVVALLTILGKLDSSATQSILVGVLGLGAGVAVRKASSEAAADRKRPPEG
jgi:hypothetical protein